MKKIYILLFFVFCIFVFTGCRDKQKEVSAVVPKITTAYLNKFIANAGYNTCFKIDDNEIFCVSIGEKSDTADNSEEEIFKPVSFCRRYNADNMKVDIISSEFNFENDDKCTVAYELKISRRIFAEKTPGIIINSNLPVNWTGMSSDEKINFRDGFYNLLLPSEFDYSCIYKNDTVDTKTVQEKLTVTLKYDRNKKIWNSSEYDFHESLKAQKTDFLKKDYSSETAVAKLAGHGLVYYNKKFFLPEDNVEIQQKIDDGYIFINGAWMLRSDYNNLRDIAKITEILNAAADAPDVFLPVFNKILSILKTDKDLQHREKTLRVLNSIIVSYINNLKKYRDIVDVLTAVNKNSDWELLDRGTVKNLISRKWQTAVQGLVVFFEQNSRFDEFIREYCYLRDNRDFDEYGIYWKTAFRKSIVKLQKQLTTIEKTLKRTYGELPKAGPVARERLLKELKKNLAGFENLNLASAEYKNYMKIWDLLLSKDWDYTYEEVKEDDILKHIFSDCPVSSCKKGEFFCKACKNTRICAVCNGTGVTFVPTSSQDGSSCRPDCKNQLCHKEYTDFFSAQMAECSVNNCEFCKTAKWYKIHCRKDCRECYGKGGKCRYCRGRSYVLTKNSDYVKKIHSEIMGELNKKIKEFHKIATELR